MTAADKAFCVSWCEAHARKWQILNRSQWKYQFHEKTLVRFVEEVQLREDEVTLLLEYLSSDECVATLSLYDQTIGAEWKPTRVWLELSNKSQGNVHAVRLYHGLNTALSAIGDGPYLVEDGCVYKVYLTYYWNQASVLEVPASESGIGYKITGLTRDRDTGLYTYAIEKRVRVQQDVAEYFTARTVFADSSESYHLGVRQNLVETTGEAASVNNGRIVKRKISKNSDCTSDVHNTIEQEIAVPGASESVQKRLTGTTVTTVNRNMVGKAETSGLRIGESVENSETEGGRWNQTVRTVLRNALDWISGSCRKTVFHHVHSETVVQSENPGFTHVESAHDGIVKEKDVSLTSDGSYQVTDKETEEYSVPGASESVHKTLTGATKTVVNRNMPSKASSSGLGIGEAVENTETDGGRWTQTIKTVVRDFAQKISDSCGKTIFAHRHGTVEIQGSDPGFTHVESASGGIVSRKSSTLTSDGSYRIEDEVTEELPVGEASVKVHKTLRGVVRTTVNRNQASPLPTNGLKIGESVENGKTDGGLYNTSKTEATTESVGRIAVSETEDRHSKHRSETTNVADNPGEPDVKFDTGSVEQKSVRATENGTYDVTNAKTDAKASVSFLRWTDAYNEHVECKYRNQPSPLDPGTVGAYTVISQNATLNDFNLYDGTYTITTRLSYSGGNGGKKGEKSSHARTIKLKLYFTPFASWGRNAKKVRWYRWVTIKFKRCSACGTNAIANAYEEVEKIPQINTDDGTLPRGFEKYESKVIDTNYQAGGVTWQVLESFQIDNAWNMETVR